MYLSSFPITLFGFSSCPVILSKYFSTHLQLYAGFRVPGSGCFKYTPSSLRSFFNSSALSKLSLGQNIPYSEYFLSSTTTAGDDSGNESILGEHEMS